MQRDSRFTEMALETCRRRKVEIILQVLASGTPSYKDLGSPEKGYQGASGQKIKGMRYRIPSLLLIKL